MRRRNFIAGLGSAAAAWPVAAWAQAQQTAVPVIGFLSAGPPEIEDVYTVAPFRKGLSEAGFVEGHNVAIEYRFAQGEFAQLPQLAADLIRRRVAVIVAPSSTPAAVAAKAATSTIPIVFTGGTDPVQIGLVAGLNRPGGNVTGISSMNTELTAKRLALLHELLPGAERIAVLVNSTNPDADVLTREAQAAVRTMGRQIEVLTAATNPDIDTAFKTLVQRRADALMVTNGNLFAIRAVQLVTLAAQHRVPALYYTRLFAQAGGLMSYGTDGRDGVRQAGIYVGRILKGEKPSDLPVIRATKFDFVINLKTAKALGLTIPPNLLAIADEVIE
jgi:putative tryptophan/tyrosine transport system substrate-binding protein